MVFNSLKAALPTLAPVLSTTPDTLYCRQRELVALGLLPPSKGRGPGSGTPASLATVSVLIASLLVTDSLSELQSIDVKRMRRISRDVLISLRAGSGVCCIRSQKAPISVSASIAPEMIQRIRDLIEARSA